MLSYNVQSIEAKVLCFDLGEWILCDILNFKLDLDKLDILLYNVKCIKAKVLVSINLGGWIFCNISNIMLLRRGE